MEELGDAVFALIADELAAGLLKSLGRALVLDHDEGNAVHIGHDIAAFGGAAARALDSDFSSYMEGIVGRVFPVDETEAETLGISVNRLGDRGAKDQCVIDVLIGGLEAFDPVGSWFEAADRVMRVFKVKGVGLAAILEGVELQELLNEDVIEHHVAEAAAPLADDFGFRHGRVTERHQHLQGRDLGLVFFGRVEGVGGHSGLYPSARAIRPRIPFSRMSIGECSE